MQVEDDRRAALLAAEARATRLFEAIEASGVIAAGRARRRGEHRGRLLIDRDRTLGGFYERLW
jgi:hypothetical protein